jgi:hypothetical protein
MRNFHCHLGIVLSMAEIAMRGGVLYEPLLLSLSLSLSLSFSYSVPVYYSRVF